MRQIVTQTANAAASASRNDRLNGVTGQWIPSGVSSSWNWGTLAVDREGRSLGVHLARYAHHVDDEIAHQGRGDVIEHDRRDDDVAVALGLKIAGNERERRAEQRGADDRGEDQRIAGQEAEMERDKRRAEARDIGLALDADVEQPRVEADGDRKAGEDETGRVIEREADAFEIAERAGDENLHRLERILADRQHDETGNDEGCGDIDERDQRNVRPDGQGPRRRAHAARSLTPAMRRPRSWALVSSGRRSPVTRPAHEHDDAVGKGEDLVELDRNQQQRLAGVALGDDALVDEFDRADVDAAGRLPDQEDLGIALDLARQHDLLLIAAGEVGGLEQRRRRPDVEGLHLPLRVGDDRPAIEQHALAVHRLLMEAEHRAFARLERHDEADAMAVLRHVADADEALGARIALHMRQRLAVDEDFAGAWRAHAGERLEELRLAVAGDAGDAEDFALPQDEGDVVDAHDAAVVAHHEIARLEHDSRRDGRGPCRSSG